MSLPYIGMRVLRSVETTEEGVTASRYVPDLHSYITSITVFEGETEAVRQVETRLRASFKKGDPTVGFHYDFGSGNFYMWRMTAE